MFSVSQVAEKQCALHDHVLHVLYPNSNDTSCADHTALSAPLRADIGLGHPVLTWMGLSTTEHTFQEEHTLRS